MNLFEKELISFEDKEDIEQTLALMKEFKTDFLDVNSYMPLAGTTLYEAMSEEEKRGIDWGKVGMKSYDNFFSKHLTPEELRRYRDEAYEIAASVQRKTIPRLGARMVVDMMTKPFRR